ncbi:MAG: hypothetical protein ACRCVB_01710 [Cetobacterium sp.]|uniref:hypothetical protein n=1 Tax=Cetobacterium sp. ZWU0022 TaxID=1340502 RepID=UPI0012E0129E|nr:hypothetical protein [Cetobacterium sp. ZWU0022]
MKKNINLIDKNGKNVSFEIGGIFSMFQILKIKKLIKDEGYVLATEKDAEIALELKIYN